MAFCDWLSVRTGMPFSLPTEAQWEYACRGGSDQELFFGDSRADFSDWANMAGLEFRKGYDVTGLQITGGIEHLSLAGAALANKVFDDGNIVTAPVGSYRANPFGIFDIHGNVSEWTCSGYQSYPYRSDDGRNDTTIDQPRVVRGGSFFDRPRRCRSALRTPYPQWRKLFDVGFRIVATATDATIVSSAQ